MNKYSLAFLMIFFQWVVHVSLLSSVTPRYFVELLKVTFCPSIISLFGRFSFCLFVKIMVTVFEGLNFSPVLSPHSTNLLTTFLYSAHHLVKVSPCY